MSELLTISDAAKNLSVSIDTIRRWEKKGLIKSTRTDQNYRLFNLEEVSRVHNKTKGGEGSVKTHQVLHNDTRTNYTSIDLFAGAGGTALGLHNAGLNHLLLNEYEKGAAQTLRDNMPDWRISDEDVHKVDFKEFLGSVDVVEGGFPCQSFSYAGKKKGFEDTRGTLFHEFARCVSETRPKIAVGENVKGLYKHDDGRTLRIMVGTLQRLGYKVATKILRSQYLDVAQKRERLVIIAVRNDIDVPILYPREKDYTVSLREAIGDKPKAPGQSYTEKKARIMSMVPAGGYWRDLPADVQKEYMMASYYMGGGKTGMARRLSWDEPSLTLTCNPAQKQTERCHPEETRPLNVREYARIQTFPDNWKFAGSTASQYKQIGNAVPVNLGFHIGEAVIAMLSGKKDEAKFVEVEPQAAVDELGAPLAVA